jgi:hypothetical protein
MNLLLQREASGDDHTYGVLRVDGLVLQTIERPWIPAPDHVGGANGISCVPFGFYHLVLHDTELHPETWALVNPSLGVWHLPGDIPVGVQGRSAVLIHPANVASELLGCIAPGMERGTLNGQAAVLQSRLAFAKIKALVPWTLGHTLEIVEN